MKKTNKEHPRIREVKLFGGSCGIHISKEDLIDLGIKCGSIVDISDIVVIKNE